MKRRRVVGIDLSLGSCAEFIDQIVALGRIRSSSYVCMANVHMTIQAHKDEGFAKIVNGADILAPDGMPLVKALKLLQGITQDRVAGMDLMPDLLHAAETQGLAIYFYGSTGEVLERIVARANREHPDLKIAGTHSPPFAALDDFEEQEVIDDINSSDANVVLVALGCPKQERWMAKNKGKIHAVMVGVGGAFSVYAGFQKRAPQWMQRCSLEWLFRLGQEPRRLFKRYLLTNALFLLLFIGEFFRSGLRPGKG